MSFDPVTVLLIFIGMILLIGGLAIVICLVQYARASTQVSSGSTLLPMTNNAQSKRAKVIVKEAPPIRPSPIQTVEPMIHKSAVPEDSPPDKQDAFLQLGCTLIDRPIGAGLQPFHAMGPVLMRFQMSEQHWT